VKPICRRENTGRQYVGGEVHLFLALHWLYASQPRRDEFWEARATCISQQAILLNSLVSGFDSFIGDIAQHPRINSARAAAGVHCFMRSIARPLHRFP
jgi:hypothetical protein